MQALQTLNETGKYAEIKFSPGEEKEKARRRRAIGQDVSILSSFQFGICRGF